jgi:ATP-dependent helicase/nuclease subunit B
MGHDPFVAQLAGLCRTHPTRAKWVFVPTHAMGATLGERLAREGTDWVNLRFVTPLDVAVRVAAPFLLERGLDPSEEPLGPALVMRLLLEQPEGGGYFRPMAEQPSMADALWRTLRELRYAGLSAADLPAGAFVSPAKHAELTALLRAYEQHLAGLHLADMPVVLDEALRHLDWCPILAGDAVVEVPDVLWSPLVRRLLDALPGERIRPRALAHAGGRLPRRAGDLAAAAQRVPRAAGANPAAADMFHAGGRDAEVAETLRRVALCGDPLDQAEIVCASREDAVLVWERAQRLGWPVTVAAGIPITLTRPGRLLLRLAEWVGGNFASSDLRRLLHAGDCSPAAFHVRADAGSEGATDAVLTPGQAARLLLKAGTTWGRATYAPSLARLARDYEDRAADGEASDEDRVWNGRKGAQTRSLAAWIADVLAAIPEPDPARGVVPLGSVASAALAFVTGNVSRASALDALALVAIDSALTDLGNALRSRTCDLPSALALVRASVESLAIGRDRPRPGALHVSTLHEAGFDGRRRVFVTGLVEGGVFPPAVEDPVLLDAERQAISPLLRTSADRIDEAVWTALVRLEAVRASAAHICLSYPCRVTRQFRDSHPSWLMLRAFREQRGDASLTYQDLVEALGDPASAVPAVPDAAVSDAEWWLAGAARHAAARPSVVVAFPPLGAGIDAEAARASTGFTRYDGFVPEAGPVLDPGRDGRVTSATTLEQAAACPFSYFLRQGLGVRPIEEEEPNADVWLDARTRGSELHALFARLMRTLRTERKKPDIARDLERLRAWGRKRLDELRVDMPPPSDEVYVRESREFCDDLEAFLVAECAGHHGADPVGFEVGFGFPLEGGEEPLANPAPLEFDLGAGRTLRLHGRIDRVNRLKPGEYEVVDYKTGGYWADGWAGEFAGGTRLQHAIYGFAAANLLKPVHAGARVTRGRYVFPAVKGHGRQKLILAPTKAALVAVLRDLADVIASGAFVAADSKNACRWCDFAAACHPSAVDGASSKVDSPDNDVLDAFRRLRGHE